MVSANVKPHVPKEVAVWVMAQQRKGCGFISGMLSSGRALHRGCGVDDGALEKGKIVYRLREP